MIDPEPRDTIYQYVMKYFAATLGRSVRQIVVSEEKIDGNDLGDDSFGVSFLSRTKENDRTDPDERRAGARRRHGGGKDVDYTKRAIHINKLVFADTRCRGLVRLLPWRRASTTKIPPLIRAAAGVADAIAVAVADSRGRGGRTN